MRQSIFRTAAIAALGVACGTGAMAAGTPLSLVNGWTNSPFSTRPATVRTINNVVHFTGAIAGGSSAVAFTLPSGFLPVTDVYVHIDLCNSTNGRLHITPSGVTDIEEEDGALTNAQCFTSLDGANFALTDDQFTALTLKNKWTNAPYSTSIASVRKISGIVQFKGAISGGKSAVAFTLPKAFRPITDVYVPVDLCNATKGRIHVTPVLHLPRRRLVRAEHGELHRADPDQRLDRGALRHLRAGRLDHRRGDPLQGRHRHERLQHRALRPARHHASEEGRLHPRRPVRRHQRPQPHRARRHRRRGSRERRLRQRPVLHLPRRRVLHQLTARHPRPAAKKPPGAPFAPATI